MEWNLLDQAGLQPCCISISTPSQKILQIQCHRVSRSMKYQIMLPLKSEPWNSFKWRITVNNGKGCFWLQWEWKQYIQHGTCSWWSWQCSSLFFLSFFFPQRAKDFNLYWSSVHYKIFSGKKTTTKTKSKRGNGRAEEFGTHNLRKDIWQKLF